VTAYGATPRRPGRTRGRSTRRWTPPPSTNGGAIQTATGGAPAFGATWRVSIDDETLAITRRV